MQNEALGVVVHANNPSTPEAKDGKTLSQNTSNNSNKKSSRMIKNTQ